MALFRRVYEEFTTGDFNLNFAARHEPQYNDRMPAVKSVPEEHLNKIGFLAQLYMTGLPEWLLVDRDIRRNLMLAKFARPPFKFRKEARQKSQLSTFCIKAPSVPFYKYNTVDQGCLDFLFMWNQAMQHHLWKKVTPRVPRMNVVKRCKCGIRSEFAVCRSCQIRYLEAKLREAKALWRPLLKKNPTYKRGSLLPYFYTADSTFLPDIDSYNNYYTSPLNTSDVNETAILRRLQATVGEWLPELYRFGPEDLIRTYVPDRTNTSKIGRNPTSIPVRMYSMLYRECIRCGRSMDFPAADDPHWYEGNVLCDHCIPQDDTCILCGSGNSHLGVCLPCISERCRVHRSLSRSLPWAAQKIEIVSACTGTYRLPDQHLCLKGDLFYELEEINLPKPKVCKRCGKETHFTNRGFCYSCRTTVWRQEKKRHESAKLVSG